MLTIEESALVSITLRVPRAVFEELETFCETRALRKLPDFSADELAHIKDVAAVNPAGAAAEIERRWRSKLAAAGSLKQDASRTRAVTQFIVDGPARLRAERAYSPEEVRAEIAATAANGKRGGAK